jgi:catechol-2,3-dioxygenase
VHLAVYVERGSLDRWATMLAESGVAFEGPVTFSAENGSLFLPDPDGNIVELADWGLDWAGEPVGD